MAESTIWWLLAGSAIAVELVSGTFYLLMLAIGLVAGALAAHLGASLAVQLVAGAVIGGGSVIAWHTIRARGPARLAASANPDVNLDVGEVVHVHKWNADGTAPIKYRGAQWTVIHVPGDYPVPGAWRIKQVVGSRFVVEKTEEN
ncbi:MAG: NfeD family protein [Ramlibacter sp.]|jgi:membrane protein implicated in regulation of membrane protease activity|nr:NfeD family protein [Ramlibacter sp.]